VNTLEQLIDQLQVHLSNATMISGWKYPVPAIVCHDGTVFSVQASVYTYCRPRSNTGPWTHVEVMTVSNNVAPLHWCHDECAVGAYVPIESVAQEILDRGGLLAQDARLICSQ
jgi:hypothetical protein